MHIISVGLNYRTAPVEVRERFALSDEEMPQALTQLANTQSIMECVIVATCNRTELYAVADRQHVCINDIQDFMEKWFHVPGEQFTKHLYIHENEKAVEHLLRVTSGLDSMVIGETQILGQVRDAFLAAQKQKTTGSLFNTLFKQAVTMAKRAHTVTAIGESAVSVSYAAVELGKRIFDQFANKTVMVIGAGETSELTAKHLYSNGAKRVIVVNRTLDRAKALADKFQGRAWSLEEAIDKLHEADIIISSTGSDRYVLTRRQVEAAIQRRKSKPMFLIDIAVPRDIDPDISSLDNVFLYDIDDLEGIVESNLEQRRLEAAKIEAMIENEKHQFEHWYRTRGIAPLIQALQTKANDIHQETMDSLTNKLPNLDEKELKVIRKLTKSMVNQMLQDPIVRMKELAGGKQGGEAAEMFIELFALEEQLAARQQEERSEQPQSRIRIRNSSFEEYGGAPCGRGYFNATIKVASLLVRRCGQ